MHVKANGLRNYLQVKAIAQILVNNLLLLLESNCLLCLRAHFTVTSALETVFGTLENVGQQASRVGPHERALQNWTEAALDVSSIIKTFVQLHPRKLFCKSIIFY